MKMFPASGLLVCLAGLAGAAPVSAGVEEWPPAAAYESGPTRDQIIEDLQRRYNARVVRVDEQTVDGRIVYEVRLLSDDKVWTVRVDAATGRELPRR